MADNLGVWDYLTFKVAQLRSSDIGGVQTLHAIVDAFPIAIDALLVAIEANTGVTATNTGNTATNTGDTATNTGATAAATAVTAGAVAAAKMQTDVKTITLPTTVVNGQKTVAATGTAEALAGATTLLSVVSIKALISNTGNIFVGNSGVDSTNGYVLAQGESVVLSVADLATVFIDSAVNGDGVSFLGS